MLGDTNCSGVALISEPRGDRERAKPFSSTYRPFHRLDGTEDNRRANGRRDNLEPSQLIQWVGSIAPFAFAILRMTPKHIRDEPIRGRPLLSRFGTNHPGLLF